MACECIPNMKKAFREYVTSASTNCPRMCKQKWQYIYLKGFPFECVNDALGETKEIYSTLEPEISEEPLMASIMECDEEIYARDLIAQSWEQRLRVEKKNIFWKSLYDLDVASRDPEVQEEQQEEEQQQDKEEQHQDDQQQEDNHSARFDASLEVKLTRAMQAGFRRLNQRIDVLDRELRGVKQYLKTTLNRGGGHDSEAEDGYEFGGNGYDFGGGDDRGEEEASPAATPAATLAASPAASPAVSPEASPVLSPVASPPASPTATPPASPVASSPASPPTLPTVPSSPAVEEDAQTASPAAPTVLASPTVEEDAQTASPTAEEDGGEQCLKRQQKPSKYIQTPYTYIKTYTRQKRCKK